MQDMEMMEYFALGPPNKAMFAHFEEWAVYKNSKPVTHKGGHSGRFVGGQIWLLRKKQLCKQSASHAPLSLY